MSSGPRSRAGTPEIIGVDATLADVIERAFDYRGDVTVGSAVRPGPGRLSLQPQRRARRAVRADLRLRRRRARTIPYAEIRAIRFTGRDTAAGNSYAAWLSAASRSARPRRRDVGRRPQGVSRVLVLTAVDVEARGLARHLGLVPSAGSGGLPVPRTAVSRSPAPGPERSDSARARTSHARPARRLGRCLWRAGARPRGRRPRRARRRARASPLNGSPSHRPASAPAARCSPSLESSTRRPTRRACGARRAALAVDMESPPSSRGRARRACVPWSCAACPTPRRGRAGRSRRLVDRGRVDRGRSRVDPGRGREPRTAGPRASPAPRHRRRPAPGGLRPCACWSSRTPRGDVTSDRGVAPVPRRRRV